MPNFRQHFIVYIYLDTLSMYNKCFYKEDMIHPSTQAVNYIFEKFGKSYFSEETQNFIKENFKIIKNDVIFFRRTFLNVLFEFFDSLTKI